MTISLRRYRETDKEEVFSLHQAALLATCSFVLSGEEVDKDFNDIESYYFQNHGYFLIAEHENKIIGMVGLRKIDFKTAEMKRMRVHPDFQGHGLGKKLLHAIESKALELGYTRILLDTGFEQIAAQKLYEKYGYKLYKRATFMELEMLYYEKYLDGNQRS